MVENSPRMKQTVKTFQFVIIIKAEIQTTQHTKTTQEEINETIWKKEEYMVPNVLLT